VCVCVCLGGGGVCRTGQGRVDTQLHLESAAHAKVDVHDDRVCAGAKEVEQVLAVSLDLLKLLVGDRCGT
jgi:hypothetical protein